MRGLPAKLEPSDAAPERVELYRHLVRGRLLGALQASIPRTLARLGPSRVSKDLGHFLRLGGATSPYVRDVAGDFVDWLADEWRRHPTVPDYVVDLARHELLAIAVASADDAPVVDPPEAVTAQSRICLGPATRMASYDYAVHRLPEDDSDTSTPLDEPTSLLAYRDAELRVRYLELSALGAALLGYLAKGEPLAEAALRALADTGTASNDSTLAGIAAFLQDLEDRGVLACED